MGSGCADRKTQIAEMAGVTGLEPAASGVTGRRSNQLSYTPAAIAPRRRLGSPATPWVSSKQPANP